MKISKNFSYEEFVNSSTAKRYEIDNKPDKIASDNIRALAYILQKIRDRYEKPIIIDSGYRCEELNNILKGAKNSDHLYGAAVDIRSLENSRVTNKEMFDLIIDMVNEGVIELRQIIDEYNYSWVHISINNQINKRKINEVLHIS